MSRNIINTAQLTCDNMTVPPTCPVVTRVEPNIEVHKHATTDKGRFKDYGIIGENRKVTYDILLTNYSSTDFTNVVIKDTLKLSPEIAASEVSYITEQSLFPDGAELPDIVINIGTLAKESQMVVHYTLQFADTVPIGTAIENTAKIDYMENTNKTEEGERIPFETEKIILTISYSSTTIEAIKTGPEYVMCNEDFDYVLTFINTGEHTATEISIQDELPEGFEINAVMVKNGDLILRRGRDYEYKERANTLAITSVGDGLNIASGSTLVITVNGRFRCDETCMCNKSCMHHKCMKPFIGK